MDIRSPIQRALWLAPAVLFNALSASAQDAPVNLLEPLFAVEPAQQAQKPREPEHTGLAALVYKTGADFSAFPRRRVVSHCSAHAPVSIVDRC
jgi:hypothetical protein